MKSKKLKEEKKKKPKKEKHMEMTLTHNNETGNPLSSMNEYTNTENRSSHFNLHFFLLQQRIFLFSFFFPKWNETEKIIFWLTVS